MPLSRKKKKVQGRPRQYRKAECSICGQYYNVKSLWAHICVSHPEEVENVERTLHRNIERISRRAETLREYGG